MVQISSGRLYSMLFEMTEDTQAVASAEALEVVSVDLEGEASEVAEVVEAGKGNFRITVFCLPSV